MVVRGGAAALFKRRGRESSMEGRKLGFFSFRCVDWRAVAAAAAAPPPPPLCSGWQPAGAWRALSSDSQSAALQGLLGSSALLIFFASARGLYSAMVSKVVVVVVGFGWC